MTAKLPEWAEAVLRAWVPLPGYGEGTPDAAATERYRQIEHRIRRRWRAELQPDVWALFNGHDEQAAILLALLIDLARHGSPRELSAKRQALSEMTRLESELRELAESLVTMINDHAELGRLNAVASGIDDDVLANLRIASEAVTQQQWPVPWPMHADHAEAISSRKAKRDSLVAMLRLLDMYKAQLAPVELTDSARATIYNVIHDCDGDGYSAEAVKKARADLRRRR